MKISDDAILDRTRDLPASRVWSLIVRIESSFRFYSSLSYIFNLIYVHNKAHKYTSAQLVVLTYICELVIYFIRALRDAFSKIDS